MSLDSEEWRMRGNEDFEMAKESSSDSKRLYESAMDCYTHAMDLSRNDKEYSSAAKNYAMACVKLTEYHKYPWDKDSRIKHISGSLEYFSKAKSRGSTCQSEKWSSHITKVYETSLKAALRLVGEFPTVEKAHLLQTLVKEMHNDNNKRQWLLKAVQILYDEAVRTEDDMAASDLLTEAIKPLERARSLGAITAHWDDRIEQTKRVICARMHFQKATVILADATAGDTHDADLLFAAIDTFMSAIKFAEDTKHEVEAEAYSQLGHIYESILSNPDRAKNYYRKCIYIADNILPKSFLQQDWYIRCTEAMKDFQKQAVEDADDKEYQEKREYLEELKCDLDSLKAKAGEGIPSLLAFISARYSPKARPVQPLNKTMLSCLDSQALRREVLKLVSKYHLDKQRGQDKKWMILCEEITKELNNALEKLKLQM